MAMNNSKLAFAALEDEDHTEDNTEDPTDHSLEDHVITQSAPKATFTKQFVEVIAPTDLQGGYQFMVDAGIKSLLVRVPDEGVRAGQRFDAFIVSEGSNHSIPKYHWRDDVCDCCIFGWCHPTLCLSFWCSACALGQVLTRMKLNCLGTPLNGTIPRRTAFRVLFILTVMKIMLVEILRLAAQLAVMLNQTELMQNDKQNPEESGSQLKQAGPWLQALAFCINLFFFILVVIVTMRTRAYIRQLYKIEEQRCLGCEDFCCAFWCNPCTIGQMARHTANFYRYPAGCCSENGMAGDAPDVV